jgi:hypothetical protein
VVAGDHEPQGAALAERPQAVARIRPLAIDAGRVLCDPSARHHTGGGEQTSDVVVHDSVSFPWRGTCCSTEQP